MEEKKMSKKQKKSLFYLGENKEIKFPIYDKIFKEKWKPDSIWLNEAVLVVIVLLCLIANLAAFNQLMSMISYDSPLLSFVAIIALLIGVDVGPVYLALQLKRKDQGYRGNNVIIGVLCTVIAIAIIANLVLRISTADDSFVNLASNVNSLVNTGQQVNASNTNSHALAFATIFSVLLIITSGTSFAIAFTLTNVLAKDVKKMEMAYNETMNDIAGLKAILEEYRINEDYQEHLLSDDHQKYIAVSEMINVMKEEYRHYVIERIIEFLGDHESTSILLKSTTSKIDRLS